MLLILHNRDLCRVKGRPVHPVIKSHALNMDDGVEILLHFFPRIIISLRTGLMTGWASEKKNVCPCPESNPVFAVGHPVA
jgi:hypothetical protein